MWFIEWKSYAWLLRKVKAVLRYSKSVTCRRRVPRGPCGRRCPPSPPSAQWRADLSSTADKRSPRPWHSPHHGTEHLSHRSTALLALITHTQRHTQRHTHTHTYRHTHTHTHTETHTHTYRHTHTHTQGEIMRRVCVCVSALTAQMQWFSPVR